MNRELDSWLKRVLNLFVTQTNEKDESKTFYKKYVTRETPLPERLANYAEPAMEQEPTDEVPIGYTKNQRGYTYFCDLKRLPETVKKCQVIGLAQISKARMSGVTFQLVRDVGDLVHVTSAFDPYMPPGLIHIRLADDSNVYIQVREEAP